MIGPRYAPRAAPVSAGCPCPVRTARSRRSSASCACSRRFVAVSSSSATVFAATCVEINTACALDEMGVHVHARMVTHLGLVCRARRALCPDAREQLGDAEVGRQCVGHRLAAARVELRRVDPAQQLRIGAQPLALVGRSGGCARRQAAVARGRLELLVGARELVEALLRLAALRRER